MNKCDPYPTSFLEPYYTHPCVETTEDHARHVILHQYVACILIPDQWVIPQNNSSIRVQIPAVVDVLIGCCLWNPEYGHFVVTSFDKTGQSITVTRKASDLTASPGTVVPSCTKFIFTPNV